MKKCTKCREEKPLEQFCQDLRKASGKGAHCLACHRNRTKNWSANNSEKHRAARRRWVLANKDVANAANVRWRERNPEIMYAHVEKRKAKIKQATPLWLTQEEKSAMFNMWKNKPTDYAVDHIVPIQGENFSGLNVPWNLRYLDRIENIRKKNKLPEKELQIGTRY